jgi:hypothetical protein
MNCVYFVRCNLFHGGKHMENKRDRQLMTAAFVFVANLLAHYIDGTIVGGWDRFENVRTNATPYSRADLVTKGKA